MLTNLAFKIDGDEKEDEICFEKEIIKALKNDGVISFLNNMSETFRRLRAESILGEILSVPPLFRNAERRIIILFGGGFRKEPLVGADMVELADTSDLGSDALRAWRFESSYPHFRFFCEAAFLAPPTFLFDRDSFETRRRRFASIFVLIFWRFATKSSRRFVVCGAPI